MDRDALKSVIEGLIFAGTEPVTVDALRQAVGDDNTAEVVSIVEELEHEYRERSRGFTLERIAGGFQFRSLPHIAPYIRELRKIKPSRLSRPALETLAIVAYNQPITRARVERIRGVESSATIRNLCERGLIEVVGKKDIPGRPLLYGTSRRFLEVFGLTDLTGLPPLPDPENIQDLPDDILTEPEAG